MADGCKIGRPKKRLKPGDYAKIQELASRGCSEKSIAHGLGMSPDTWRRLRDTDPRATEAHELGRAVEHDALVGALYQAALKGNIVAGIFLLKARHGYVEGQRIEHQSNVRITVDLPRALSPEEYGRLIEQQPPALPNGGDDDD